MCAQRSGLQRGERARQEAQTRHPQRLATATLSLTVVSAYSSLSLLLDVPTRLLRAHDDGARRSVQEATAAQAVEEGDMRRWCMGCQLRHRNAQAFVSICLRCVVSILFIPASNGSVECPRCATTCIAASRSAVVSARQAEREERGKRGLQMCKARQSHGATSRLRPLGVRYLAILALPSSCELPPRSIPHPPRLPQVSPWRQTPRRPHPRQHPPPPHPRPRGRR